MLIKLQIIYNSDSKGHEIQNAIQRLKKEYQQAWPGGKKRKREKCLEICKSHKDQVGDSGVASTCSSSSQSLEPNKKKPKKKVCKVFFFKYIPKSLKVWNNRCLRNLAVSFCHKIIIGVFVDIQIY